MHTSRQNIEFAADVDQALALAKERGVRAAAAFLADHGAGFALTCRTLAEPARRRPAASPQAPAIHPPPDRLALP
jgi:hypothetical protein